MSPIERCAKALQAAWDDGSDVASGLPPIEFTEAEKLHLARAVLQALREPDDFMIRAGIIKRHEGEVPEAWSKATANIYTAMIDAALSE